MTAKEAYQIKDESNDRKYFLMRPAIVKMKARSVYDIAVWDAIKEVAGENGECFLSSENLAALAMVSVGQLSDSRKYLIEVGLLEGEIRKRSEHGQAMWHLRIPDLWEENITLMSTLAWHDKLTAFLIRSKKQTPLEGLKFAEELDRQCNTGPSEKSLHHMKPSPHEGKPSPHEGSPPQKPSPHEIEEEPYRIRSQEEESPPLFSEKLNGKDFLQLAAVTEEERGEVEPGRVIAEHCASLLKVDVPDYGYERNWLEPCLAMHREGCSAGLNITEIKALLTQLYQDNPWMEGKVKTAKGFYNTFHEAMARRQQAATEAASRAETRARYEKMFQASVAAVAGA